MKKILVPTDFSLQAKNALKVAAQLAKKYHCDIYLLHVLEIPLHTVDPLTTYNNLPEAVYFMKLAHKQFEGLKAKDYLKNLTVHEKVEFQDLFKSVFHVCKKEQID
ncbi:MAG TPA: universal stress protein, partial [Mariniflexile sp.]|nr:universal stress protein [Mariniflexile sp.]